MDPSVTTHDRINLVTEVTNYWSVGLLSYRCRVE